MCEPERAVGVEVAAGPDRAQLAGLGRAHQLAPVPVHLGVGRAGTPPSDSTVTLKWGTKFDRTVAGTAESLEFHLTIDDGAGTTESFPWLTTDASHPRYWNVVVESAVVRLKPHDPPPAIAGADPRPDDGTVTLGGSAPDDPAAAWSHVLLAPAPTSIYSRRSTTYRSSPSPAPPPTTYCGRWSRTARPRTIASAC